MFVFFFFSSRRRHTRLQGDWSSDVCSSDLGSAGGPGWLTHIVTLDSGVEQRNVLWAQDRGRWDVGLRNLGREDLLTLLAFFQARRGRADSFRFKDWFDFEADAAGFG